MTAFAFSIGNKGYVGIGYSGSTFCNDWWEYNPAVDTWTKKADFPGGLRQRGISFAVNGKGYVGLGSMGNTLYGDIWEYDPTTDSWTQKNNFGGTPRVQAVGFAIGNKGYVGTGIDNPSTAHFTKDFWEYDPINDSWTQKTDFPGTIRSSATGFSIGTKGFVGTGDYTSVFSDFWEYNSNSDTWVQKASFGGGPIYYAVSFSINDKGYVGTGSPNSTSRSKVFYEYDTTLNQWTHMTDVGIRKRTEAIGFSIGNKGYIGTGYDSAMIYDKDFWEFSNGLTSIDQSFNSIHATITPNPSNNHLLIEASTENCMISIFNADGQLLLYKKFISQLNIDVSEFREGIYCARIQSGEYITTKKIVVSHSQL